MSNLFGEQLAALRAHSLHRELREIEGAEVSLAGRHLTNSPPTIILAWRTTRGCGMQP